ncbi:MAG: BrnT family toxin [Rhodocyclaceae bacterium]|nr:BrnT family toxin [Rhodocyclaceae bacterium]MDP1957880.1 BrnT family toxin [Rhodocyclaceae bacterium]
MEITYDPSKNAANIEQRGLSFDWVAELDWSSAVIVEDVRKTYGERRYRVFGYIEERLYAVVFTPRGTVVHVISFRKANSREVKHHGRTQQTISSVD